MVGAMKRGSMLGRTLPWAHQCRDLRRRNVPVLQDGAGRPATDYSNIKTALRVSPLFVESVQEVDFVIVALKTL